MIATSSHNFEFMPMYHSKSNFTSILVEITKNFHIILLFLYINGHHFKQWYHQLPKYFLNFSHYSFGGRAKTPCQFSPWPNSSKESHATLLFTDISSLVPEKIIVQDPSLFWIFEFWRTFCSSKLQNQVIKSKQIITESQ